MERERRNKRGLAARVTPIKPKIRRFIKCPRCGSDLVHTKAISGVLSEFWYECSNQNCNTYVNSYIPQDHQRAVHEDNHRYIGNFGGYGTGKTTTSREELYKHILITPRGNSLIGANVASQYEQTIKRDIEADFPAAFVSAYSAQKQTYDFRNGHRLLFRPYDDPGKLRSYNLTMFVILEASETKPEVLTQLKTRLRNLAATKPKLDEKGKVVYTIKQGMKIPVVEKNWCKGIIESNPDPGYIRSDVLFCSESVIKHGTILDYYNIEENKKDPAIASHIASSDVNVFLPPTFKEDVCKNRPAWWVNRYFYGSFLYAEGMVYPSSQSHLVPAFPVPRHWKRIVAADYGLSDNFVYLFGAVSPEDNILFIYKEVVVNNKNIEELSKLFFKNIKDVPIGGWITAPLIDPKSGNKRDYDKISLIDKFLEYGISFQPGQVNKDARIFATNTYFESGRLKILRDNCPILCNELREYKFKAAPQEDQGFLDKPVDKDDHCISALEWIVMALPKNPAELVLGVYSKAGVSLGVSNTTPQDVQKAYAHYMFTDDTPVNDYGVAQAYDIEY